MLYFSSINLISSSIILPNFSVLYYQSLLFFSLLLCHVTYYYCPIFQFQFVFILSKLVIIFVVIPYSQVFLFCFRFIPTFTNFPAHYCFTHVINFLLDSIFCFLKDTHFQDSFRKWSLRCKLDVVICLKLSPFYPYSRIRV